MRISELCACGASVVVEGATPEIAGAYILAWRSAHICSSRHELSERIGFDLFSRKPVVKKP